jgi:hypothetical protein
MDRPFKAGPWHLVGDGIVFDHCDVVFDLIWRASDGDHAIGSATHHFDPPTGGNKYDAVAFEADVAGVAVNPMINQDQLVLRFSTATISTQSFVFLPNSDGAKAHGRIPSLRYPR